MRTTWNLMGTHGIVLFYIVANPDFTIRRMSDELGLTDRRVSQVIHDLSAAGMVKITRSGRRNQYAIEPSAAFRHPTLSYITLGDFLTVLADKSVGALA
ncbi:MAG TPA: helix-turn-helix domain-containing protein [Dehalococcoidia bacterium]|nr:helix-turn-helix domain-containing protein [Dehalococcoidia bacterium]